MEEHQFTEEEQKYMDELAHEINGISVMLTMLLAEMALVSMNNMTPQQVRDFHACQSKLRDTQPLLRTTIEDIRAVMKLSPETQEFKDKILIIKQSLTIAKKLAIEADSIITPFMPKPPPGSPLATN